MSFLAKFVNIVFGAIALTPTLNLFLRIITIVASYIDPIHLTSSSGPNFTALLTAEFYAYDHHSALT